MLRHLGVANVFAEHAERYPKVALDEIARRGPDLVVLPDEPYAFTADDGAGGVPGHAVRARLGPAPHLVRPVAASRPATCWSAAQR